MTEIFELNIRATSNDGVNVKNATSVKVQCQQSTAVSVLVNLLKSDERIEQLFLDAVSIHLSGEDVISVTKSDKYDEDL